MKKYGCLNPCFSGTYSQSLISFGIVQTKQVLILVLVEHTLRGQNKDSRWEKSLVLILVLVEHTLREELLIALKFHCVS